MTDQILHATAVARWRGDAWRGVLLRGPSGSGKSSLALRAIQAGWRLVSDDRTCVWGSGGRLFARAPEALRGLVEARGLGILPHPALALAPIDLVMDLAPGPEGLERLPDPETVRLDGIDLPLFRVWPHDAAAAAKLTLALACAARTLGAEDQQAYQARRAELSDVGPGATGDLT